MRLALEEHYPAVRNNKNYAKKNMRVGGGQMRGEGIRRTEPTHGKPTITNE